MSPRNCSPVSMKPRCRMPRKSKRRGPARSNGARRSMNGESAGEPWEDVRARCPAVDRTMTLAFRPEPEASAGLEDAAVWYDSQLPGRGLEFVQVNETTIRPRPRARTAPGRRLSLFLLSIHSVVGHLAFWVLTRSAETVAASSCSRGFSYRIWSRRVASTTLKTWTSNIPCSRRRNK